MYVCSCIHICVNVYVCVFSFNQLLKYLFYRFSDKFWGLRGSIYTTYLIYFLYSEPMRDRKWGGAQSIEFRTCILHTLGAQQWLYHWIKQPYPTTSIEAVLRNNCLFLPGKRISKKSKQLMWYITCKLILNSGACFWGDCPRKTLHEILGHLMCTI